MIPILNNKTTAFLTSNQATAPLTPNNKAKDPPTLNRDIDLPAAMRHAVDRGVINEKQAEALKAMAPEQAATMLIRMNSEVGSGKILAADPERFKAFDAKEKGTLSTTTPWSTATESSGGGGALPTPTRQNEIDKLAKPPGIE